jgi:dihydrofolate reductase
MRKLISSTFASLDGVMQAPGGPTEDPTGNFTLGGWLFAFGDSGMDISAAGFDGNDREIVLGRKTYEIFEAYWPYQHTNRGQPGCENPQCGKKACGAPHFEIIGMEQFVGT